MTRRAVPLFRSPFRSSHTGTRYDVFETTCPAALQRRIRHKLLPHLLHSALGPVPGVSTQRSLRRRAIGFQGPTLQLWSTLVLWIRLGVVRWRKLFALYARLSQYFLENASLRHGRTPWTNAPRDPQSPCWLAGTRHRRGRRRQTGGPPSA